MPAHRPLRRSPRALLSILPLLLAGCGGDTPRDPTPPPPQGGGPRPEALWRVTFQETDSLYLSSPGDFWVSPDDGSFYIADRFAGRVVQYDRQGRPLKVFGRKGSGPGEFRQVSTMFTLGHELYVDDIARRAFNVFDRRTGAVVRAMRHEGIFYDIRFQDDVAWLGVQNLERGTSVARWSPGRDSLSYLLPLPEAYRRSAPLAGVFNGVFVAPWADTLAVAYQGSNEVYLFGAGGLPVDTVEVPAVRRRGVPDDLVERLSGMSFPEIARAASGVFGFNRQADGTLALVHFDQEVAGSAITARVYVSLVAADRRTACVDGALPVGSDAQPRVLFRGDTLLVMRQQVKGERPETSVTAYRLATNGCRWEPVS